jgi:hypothetical protein
MFQQKKFGLPESLIKTVTEAMKSHTVPKTEKEKKLAALAHPKDKITHKDVMVGRGVIAKEEVELEEGFFSSLKQGFQTGMRDKLKERIRPEHHKNYDIDSVKSFSDSTQILKKANKAGHLVSSKIKEEKDTPGNSYEHQCAVHVKHAKLGEGKTLFSQHAEPTEDGYIEWYDVMFEHGIERVYTTDVEILVSESHMNHKKKKNEGRD